MGESEHARSHVLSFLSHEFRTPLTAIIGFSEMLRDEEGLGPEEARQIADGINVAAKRLNRMIGQMLDLDLLESGRAELHAEPVDWRGVVLLAVEAARGVINQGRSVEVEAVEEARFTADPARVRQAIALLVERAVDLSRDGAVVRVSARASPGTVEFEAWAPMPGVAAEALPGLFERHSRLAGLSLLIVRAIARLHGGSVWARPRDGAVVALGITLPERPAEQGR